MNMRRLSSNLLLGALFLFAASCGSDKKDGQTPDPVTGGSGGGGATSGGASGGGTTGVGGMKASGGSISSGGSASGGTANMTSGGSGGSAGGMMVPGKNFGCPGEKPEEAGACMRNSASACTYDDGGCVCVDGAWDCYAAADCPASAPADAAACTLGGMACTYDNLNCTCSAMNGWTCETPCPSTTPADAASCRRASERTCRYAEGEIVQGFGGKADTTCACEDGEYECFSQADCPAEAPANESACTFATLMCSYEGQQCNCTDDAWSCTTECPDALPTDGTACLRPEAASCRYLEGAIVQGGFGKSDATCVCDAGSFSCFGQEDCPAAAPANAEACEFPSLNCAYEGSQCSCGESGWTCTTDCPDTVPAQDAACSRSEQAVCRYNDGALATGFGGAAEALCACRESKFDCLTQEDCPDAAPADESACEDLTNLSCSYDDGQQCNCGQNGWSCQTECPAQLPAAGAACMRPAFPACLYVSGALVEAGTEPESTCVCVGDVFSCYTDADCPTAQPENMAACDKPGLECSFDTQDCRCRTSTSLWSCMAPQPPQGGGGGAGGTGG